MVLVMPLATTVVTYRLAVLLVVAVAVTALSVAIFARRRHAIVPLMTIDRMWLRTEETDGFHLVALKGASKRRLLVLFALAGKKSPVLMAMDRDGALIEDEVDLPPRSMDVLRRVVNR